VGHDEGMRLSLFLATAAALLTASAALAGHAASTPRVWVNDPLTVQGTGFPAGKVVVSVRGRLSALKVVRASASGRFTARFDRALSVGTGCQMTVVTAVGLNGVRASTKTGGAPAKNCPPPLQR
jgi:hypothetical protein